MIELTILGDVPSKSNNYKKGKHSFYKDPKVIQYESDFAKQVTGKYKGRFSRETRLKIWVVWFASSKRGDADGITKVIFDCLQTTGVIHNDNKVDDPRVLRMKVDKRNPRIEIYIRAIEDRLYAEKEYFKIKKEWGQ